MTTTAMLIGIALVASCVLWYLFRPDAVSIWCRWFSVNFGRAPLASLPRRPRSQGR